MRFKGLLIAASLALASVARAQGGTIGAGGGAAAAGTLTGATLAPGVTASSLTSVTGWTFGSGTFTGGATSATITAGTGASRTFTLKSTNASSAAVTGILIGADTSVQLANNKFSINPAGSYPFALSAVFRSGTVEAVGSNPVAYHSSNRATTGVAFTGGDSVAIASNGVQQFVIAPSGVFVLPLLPAEGSTKNAMCWDGTTKNVTQNAAATCTVSSARFKTNIRAFPVADALRIVSKLHASSYSERQGGRLAIGIIAEQADSADWRLASRDAKGLVTSTNYEEVTSILLTVVKDQQRQLDSIKAAARTSRAGFDGIESLFTLAAVVSIIGLGALLPQRKVA